MNELNADRLIGGLTVGELREIIRQVVREEFRADYFIDDDGRLAFATEEGYAGYVARQAGRRPGELNAYYLDANGRKAIYSDDQPILAWPVAPSSQPGKQNTPPPAERRPDYHIESSAGDPREAALRRLRERS